MDKFLHYYLEKYEEYCERFPEYTKIFTSDKFVNNHFLEKSYVKKGKIAYFSNEEGDDILDKMWEKIEERANCIVDRKGTELYKLFCSKLKIIG